ncbi:hypothetical protein Kisp01_58250 [Kineosporia sp. NBRC 101677]|uniref:hypothetical protein n=1 Tax=Kineosporia sp. NBRC 101677 TaxID=3032197 RepID=UPI0024A2D34F|nr:hypothetical protein [Kineosporia sp. NBRC 101677]GLY18811.1 hypothetical protein Kisp01_58250 [Kineosporia sp. NBRC 101677]
MSSSVTIDWAAVREQQRREVLQLRSRLAGLARRRDQIEARRAAADAAWSGLGLKVPAVHVLSDSASVEQLQIAVATAARELDQTEEALRARITQLSTAARSAGPATRVAGAGAPVRTPDSTVTLDPEAIGRYRGPSNQPTVADLGAEADRIISECAVRCPEGDLSELHRLREGLSADPGRAAAGVDRIWATAGELARRTAAAEAQAVEREELMMLLGGVPDTETPRLRERITTAPGPDLPGVRAEIVAANEQATRERSRDAAVGALAASLSELGYDVGEGFETYLDKAAPVVLPSIHSAEHGVRVKVTEEHLYVSVVRRAGTARTGSHEDDQAVQEATCRDLDNAIERAAEHGADLSVAALRAPGERAPVMQANAWPSSDQDARRRRAAAAAQQNAARAAQANRAAQSRRQNG